MPTLYLVRHAQPSGTWAEHLDPGLDAPGQQQAQDLAREFSHRAAMNVLTSPLRRCRETASPLEQQWRRSAQVVDEVAEIPAPPLNMKDRAEWLAVALRGTWSEMQATAPYGSPDFLAWRAAVLNRLLQQREDAVIVTHYIAINVAVAAARAVDHVVCFCPDFASVTRVEVTGGRLRVLELGKQADTLVLTR